MAMLINIIALTTPSGARRAPRAIDRPHCTNKEAGRTAPVIARGEGGADVAINMCPQP